MRSAGWKGLGKGGKCPEVCIGQEKGDGRGRDNERNKTYGVFLSDSSVRADLSTSFLWKIH